MAEKKVKHSPGPWKTTGQVTRDRDGKIVDFVPNYSLPTYKAQAEANRSLRDAAPELLEALEGWIMNCDKPHSKEYGAALEKAIELYRRITN
jgi:hypothetical protein